MLSGLYGDLPEAKNKNSASGSSGSGWSAKPNFAPSTRKPAFAAPRSVLGGAKTRSRSSEGKLQQLALLPRFLGVFLATNQAHLALLRAHTPCKQLSVEFG